MSTRTSTRPTTSRTGGPVGASTASLERRLDEASVNNRQRTIVPNSTTDPERSVRFATKRTTTTDDSEGSPSRTSTTHRRRATSKTDTATSGTEGVRTRDSTADTKLETVDNDAGTLPTAQTSRTRPSSTRAKSRTRTSSSDPQTSPRRTATADTAGIATGDAPFTSLPKTSPDTTEPISGLPDTGGKPTGTFASFEETATTGAPLGTINPTDVLQSTFSPDTYPSEKPSADLGSTLLPQDTAPLKTSQSTRTVPPPRSSRPPQSALFSEKTRPRTKTTDTDTTMLDGHIDSETAPTMWTTWRRAMSDYVSRARTTLTETAVSTKRWVEAKVHKAAADLKHYLDIAYDAGTQFVAHAAQTVVDHIPYEIRPRHRGGKYTLAPETEDTDRSDTTRTYPRR